MQRWIMHLDMDAFFASVEQLDHPEWRGKPVIVGGQERGVVSAASYEARKYGVRSAIPVARARKLCPHGIFTRGNMARYAEISRQIMALLGNYSPLVEPASIDEAYLDATGLERLFGPVEAMAQSIKRDIKASVGLNCSIGIAPVKFLAKIASDYNKPDGLFMLRPEDVPAFLEALPVAKIPGVGNKFIVELESLGVKTCGDVLKYPQGFWARLFGKSGEALWRRAQGLDSREVETGYEAKSESAENTFAEDTDDMALLKKWLMKQSERVGRNQRRMGVKGRTVTLKLKYADFTSITRSRSLPEPTDATEVIFRIACELLDGVKLQQKVRLIGVGLSNYGKGPEQLNLLDGSAGGQTGGMVATAKQRSLDRTLDSLREKFGSKAVTRGRLFDFDE
ncbi:DNA polymerase IV [Desulfovibrio mangrovi]|uniref:DNA polymerase IV n=1 Tax=Desulfovibrio mangrovi TaxID=2976983 RepID=UPI00224641B1|nr:DNA polymerase IV [Desulfovibrio mangrovi]UZP69168.1 DNA polymerase IV [Desulfovibrio mangrovi]